MGSPPLRLENIGKKYGDNWVLKNLNLTFDGPGLYAIYGDNGSGKTTFIKICSGLLKPSSGRVYVYGDPVEYGGWDKSLVNALLHENVMYDELTVRENLDFYLGIYGFGSLEEAEYAYKAFESLGLARYIDYRLSSLSYGWRKRANIVRCLINSPKILFLDEPTIGLDVDATSRLVKLLSEYSLNNLVIFTVSDAEDLKQFIELSSVDVEVFRLEDGGLKHWRVRY